MLGSETPGISSPLISPDGSRAVFQWRKDIERKPANGLWIIRTSDGSHKLLCSGLWTPLQWSADGKRIFLSDSARTSIYTVTSTGGEPKLFVNLGMGFIATADISEDGSTIVAEIRDDVADVWLIQLTDTEK